MKKIRESCKDIFYKISTYIFLLKYSLKKKKNGINVEENRKEKIIVSLTTIPSRIKYLWLVIESIMNQTIKPDKIILWISYKEFADIELPYKLLKQKIRGLEIRYCEDLKPHKKYFFAMKEFTNDIIITVDDDVCYEKKLIEKLIRSYKKFPNSISCMRAHRITFDENNRIQEYSMWKKKVKIYAKERYDLIAIGIGGVLYPPNILVEEVFNTKILNEKCLFTDDIWLKIIELLSNVKVVKANKNSGWVPIISNTQKEALFHDNMEKNTRNDDSMNELIKEYKIDFNKYKD